MNKKKIFIVGGPTASGKTRLAIGLAKKHNGELINADSMQVYRGMDIGTNKGAIKQKGESKKEKVLGHDFEIFKFKIENSGVTGWLFDLVQPDFNFTVAHYQFLAHSVIKDIVSRGKTPIIVGGTGLYIDALLKRYSIEGQRDEELRARLESMSVEQLQGELSETGFDLDSLNNSDRNNPRRLVRLIEKNLRQDLDSGSSQTITFPGPGSRIRVRDDKRNPSLEDLYDVTFYYPEYNREELMQKISKRASHMLEEGLVNEVQGLLDRGYDKNLKSMQATGYKQVVDYLDGKIKTKKELVEAIALAHRQYAKRQITWFEGEGRGYELIPM